MRKLFTFALAVTVSMTAGCGATSRREFTLPALDTVGDFIDLPQRRVVTGGVTFLLPEGWSCTRREGVAMAVSPEVLEGDILGTEVRIVPVSRSEATLSARRPRQNCPVHYSRCTPIEAGLVTNYGAVWWRQTVWIDNGGDDVFRVEASWNAGTVGQGVPSLVGYIARSARLVPPDPAPLERGER